MTLAAIRRAFAEEIEAVAGLTSRGLVDAYARVAREDFLGPGPWQIALPLDKTIGYRASPDDDPRHLYHDVVVAIDQARWLNNGQPSALARWIEPLALRPGDAVAHIGSGTGYYTAILAEVVGPTGRVEAHEVDAELAARARANLVDRPWVRVHTGDASSLEGGLDAVFVNAGCTFARPAWLAALAPGGRIVLPLTVHIPGFPAGVGAMLLATRPQEAGKPWPAHLFSQVGIYDCANARDPAHEPALHALAGGPAERVAALVVEPHPRGDGCLAHVTDGFCLQ